MWVLNRAFGALTSFAVQAPVIFHDSRETFVAAWKKFHGDTSDPGDAVGFTAVAKEKGGRQIHILKAEASFDATVHELVHQHASETWNDEFRGNDVHEAVTQWLTQYALAKAGLKELSGAYAKEIVTILTTNPGTFSDVSLLGNAYFLGSKTAMERPIGEKKKSLKQLAWFFAVGDWDEPALGTLDLGDLKEATGESSSSTASSQPAPVEATPPPTVSSPDTAV